MTVGISFTKNELVKLDQILAQLVHYADGGLLTPVGGLTDGDRTTIRDNAYNFRQQIKNYINAFSTYDGTTQDASFT